MVYYKVCLYLSIDHKYQKRSQLVVIVMIKLYDMDMERRIAETNKQRTNKAAVARCAVEPAEEE